MIHAETAHLYAISSVPAMTVEAPHGTDILGTLGRPPSELNADWYIARTARTLPGIAGVANFSPLMRETLAGKSWGTAVHTGRVQGGDTYQAPPTALPLDAASTDANKTSREAQATLPMDKVIGRLRSYKELGANWNGYGGQPPSGRAVEDAVNFLRMLGHIPKLPKTMVGGSGEVGLFWETLKTYVEVGFRGDGTFGFLVDPADGAAVEEEGLPIAFPQGALAEGLAAVEEA